jgi:hypothetical protein
MRRAQLRPERAERTIEMRICKKSEPDAVVTFKAPASLAEKADQIAASEYMDRSTWLRRLIAKAASQAAA